MTTNPGKVPRQSNRNYTVTNLVLHHQEKKSKAEFEQFRAITAQARIWENEAVTHDNIAQIEASRGYSEEANKNKAKTNWNRQQPKLAYQKTVRT